MTGKGMNDYLSLEFFLSSSWLRLYKMGILHIWEGGPGRVPDLVS